MPVNKIVVHDKNGAILKGTTADFLPKRPIFHLSVGGIGGVETKKIVVDHLKAIFFVKDFEGNKHHQDAQDLGPVPGSGKKIRAVFNDGEVLTGYTHAINLDQPGFFVVPADPQSNNERVFVVFSSLRRLEVDGSLVDLMR